MSYWNLGRAHLSSASGFVLSDALIAVAVISLAAVLVQHTVQSVVSARNQLKEAAALSNADYELAVSSIGECVCTEESEDPTASGEVTGEADTSSSSY